MKTTKEVLIKGVLCSFVPAVFNFLGSTDALVWAQEKQYIGTSIDIEAAKMVCFLLSLLATFGLLSYNLIVSELKENMFRKRSTELIKYTKEIMITALAKSLGKEYCDINIRIFVPKKTLVWRIAHFLGKEKSLYFHIKNIEGLAEAGVTNNLKFRVYPDSEKEGLVGECFWVRKMVLDDNLVVSNNTDYNLTDYQKNKTNDLKFIIVCPTFNESGEIDAIVAFDSKNEIKVTNDNQEVLSNLILNYTQQLHEKVPELFKSKGGLI